jgi:phosphohistidine phosphatase
MKTLTLLRHAKSDWTNKAASDFDRPLNARGHRGAQAIGRELARQGMAFDIVLASPAARVVETVDDVAKGYGRPLSPIYDRRLYLASPAILLAIVRETDDAAERLLLVGHNPGLEALALLITRDDGNALRAELKAKFPTATLAEINLSIDRWRNAEVGAGDLARFIRPRDLDPGLGPEAE